MEALAYIILAVALFFIFGELVHTKFFGPILHNKILKDFFKEAPLGVYQLNLADQDKYMLFSVKYPYIAYHGNPIWAWYISGIGRIPRWSKWHKRLNIYRVTLIAKQPRE